MSKLRLELFSDGVFAIVLTLLVLDLKPPTLHGIAGLWQITPALLVHALVFIMVGINWMLHHRLSLAVRAVSPSDLATNLFVLFWVTLIPFGARIAAETPLDPLGISILCFITGAFMLGGSLALGGLVAQTTDDTILRVLRNRNRVLRAIAAAAFLFALLCWVSPWLGYAFLVLQQFGVLQKPVVSRIANLEVNNTSSHNGSAYDIAVAERLQT